MTEIERIFNLIREHGGVNCLNPQTAERIAKALEDYVTNAREETLIDLVPNHLIIEKCLWFGRDNDSTREMRIEINHIDNDLNKPLTMKKHLRKQ